MHPYACVSAYGSFLLSCISQTLKCTVIKLALAAFKNMQAIRLCRQIFPPILLSVYITRAAITKRIASQYTSFTVSTISHVERYRTTCMMYS